MTDFHGHLVLVWWQVSLSIGIMGTVAAGYYWRGKYFGALKRMNTVANLLDAGNFERARKILSDH